MPNASAQPAPGIEPSRPRGFPQVTLLRERVSSPVAIPSRVASPAAEVFEGETAAALPSLRDDASDTQREFHAAAVLAVRRVVDLDRDDPAELIALNERLDTDVRLAPLVRSWQPALEQGIERAFMLKHFGEPLRLLRGAFASARFDGSTGLYARVDKRACDAAYRQLMASGDVAMTLAVTVRPVGRRELAYFQALCENAPDEEESSPAAVADTALEVTSDDVEPSSASDEGADAEQDEGDAGDDSDASEDESQATDETPPSSSSASPIAFPTDIGSSKLRRVVGKLYAKTFRERIVRKVAVIGTWRPSGGEQLLRAFVAAKLGRAADAACVIEEVAIRKRNGRGGRMRCDVLRSSTVGCETLR